MTSVDSSRAVGEGNDKHKVSSKSSIFLALDKSTVDLNMRSKKLSYQSSSSSNSDDFGDKKYETKPRVREIISSESAHMPQRIDFFRDGIPKKQRKFIKHVKNHSDIMLATNYKNEEEDELQAAVDMIIKGESLNASLLGHAKPMAIPSYADQRYVYHNTEPGLMRAIENDRRSVSGLEKQSTNAKTDSCLMGHHDHGEKQVEEERKRQAICTFCAPMDMQNAGKLGRFVYPVICWIQHRPLAALSIALGALVALLAAIIAVVFVGVFPNMFRAIVQDLSFTMTSINAMPPAVPSRALHQPGPAATMRVITRVVVEPHPAAPMPAAAPADTRLLRRQNHSLPTKAVGDEVSVTVTRLSTRTLHLVKQHPANVLSLLPTHGATAYDNLRANNILPSQDPQPLLPAVASGERDIIPAGAEKYTMQFSGNLTSGGPMGVTIEFTEPLRLYWRDAEIGIIQKPQAIRVHGKGTSRWSWPPIEVSIPGAISTNKQLTKSSAAAAAKDKGLVYFGKDRIPSDNAGGIAERRVVSGGTLLGKSIIEPTGAGDGLLRSARSDEHLANWFSAIRSRQSFSMLWKSRVTVSALGVHASNVKFEKTVQVLCAESKSCTISNFESLADTAKSKSPN
ncbi:hypothetical protein GGI12_002755 [Dipsacomyces acuminosporus]|nr:hypothetical protein GGI12_002755 [Dipsacomyces acuminosporus]